MHYRWSWQQHQGERCSCMFLQCVMLHFGLLDCVCASCCILLLMLDSMHSWNIPESGAIVCRLLPRWTWQGSYEIVKGRCMLTITWDVNVLREIFFLALLSLANLKSAYSGFEKLPSSMFMTVSVAIHSIGQVAVHVHSCRWPQILEDMHCFARH